MKKRALIITVKNPVLGQVKTRLAASVGDEKALEIYLAMLRHTREVALQTQADRYLFYSNVVEANDEWPNSGFIKKKQSAGNIGQRMSACFEALMPDYEKVILIGCDIPGLAPHILEEAFEKLSGHDYVVGPAEDGGYYLIGMKEFNPLVFEGIAWSTPSVFEETIHKIKTLGKTWARVATLSDVDTWEDWQRHGWNS